MWLAEGIQEPEYSGIIFRRTFQQLNKSNDSLIAKAYRLYPAIGGKFNQTQRQWRFPSGAMIEMGALEHEQSVLNYQGNSYHRIAFDELTQFSEAQYEYLVNSRMRKTKGFPVSLGARGASNPGGPGHQWVKLRFVTDEAIAVINKLDLNELTPQGTVFYANKGRAFVPARLVDNPFLDREEYSLMLQEFTDPIMRARMLNGDWSVRQDGVIAADRLRYYDLQGEMYQNEPEGLRIDRRTLTRAIFVDCAGSSEDVAKEQRGGKASFSVAQVWDYHTSTGNMFLRHQIRGRWTFPVLCEKIDEFIASHRPDYTAIEDEKTGRALLQNLRVKGRSVRPLSPEGKDKLTRAAPLLNRISSGQVWLLRNASWMSDLQSEWFSWTGHPDEMADQIDPAAYAAREFANSGGVFHIGRTGLSPAMRN
jgi:predicted phage terminase large subunit-like protein